MSTAKYRVVHYLNQFFGQIGGEEKADIGPCVRDGAVGPGVLLQRLLGDEATVVGTVICGDNYIAEHQDSAVAEVIHLMEEFHPDLVIAGPGFNAGRYGPACGAVCKAVQEKLGIPAVTGMYPENPGVELYGQAIYCIATGSSAAGMGKAMPAMVKLAFKLLAGETIGSPSEEGYIARGYKRNTFAKDNGARRAVDMLLKRLKEQPYFTELPLPKFENVAPASAVANLAETTIALVTEGGIVPKGNPDRLESARASKFLRYSIEGVKALSGEDSQSVHGGYDNTFANQDPNRVLPLDVLRELSAEGKISGIYPYYFTTTGNGTSLENAKKFGAAMAQELIEAGVGAVLLTST